MPLPRLIAEVVSPGKANRDQDFVHKRDQYAAIRVSEYWLIDPAARTITVLTLDGKAYRQAGVFANNEPIVSVELPDLSLSVAQIFAAEL